MSTTKVVDGMRDVTVVDAAKITTGAVPAAALTNVDLVEGTKGADIASAGTMVIGTDGGYFDITGTTGISTMTVAAGRVFTLQFDAAVVLTHSSTLYLSGAADFTTEANDHLTFISVAANDVRQIGTGLKDGGSPVASAGFQTAFVNVSYNIATASGNVDFTGAGFDPKSAMVWGADDNSGIMSVGGGISSSTDGAIISISETTAGDYQVTGAAFYAHHSTGNVAVGQIAMISDGVRLAITKSGSPTGTVNTFVLMFS